MKSWVQVLIKARASQGLRRPTRKPPRQQVPEAIGLEYANTLARLMGDFGHLVMGDIRVHFDVELDSLVDRFVREIGDNAYRDVAARYINATSRYQRNQLFRQLTAKIGVDVSSLEPNISKKIDDLIAQNVTLIKSIPRKAVDEVELIVNDGIRRGLRWGEVSENIEARLDVAQSRARLIARDQVLTAYGDLQEVRQKALGIDQYVWRTVGDERVRAEHVARDGDVFDWVNPPDDGHPGDAVLCRCYAEPIIG